MSAGPDRNADVERKAEPNNDIREQFQTHAGALVFMHIKTPVDLMHAPRIKEDQCDENIDRPLLREPEAELEATDADLVHLLDE